jgi:hypothetical protein
MEGDSSATLETVTADLVRLGGGIEPDAAATKVYEKMLPAFLEAARRLEPLQYNEFFALTS